MKKLVISALALGAMTSVALAEESLTQTSGQPMQLSLAQLDDVTAGRSTRIDANVALFKNRQSNRTGDIIGGVVADDIQGRCDDCAVIVEANISVRQSNDFELEQEND